MQIAWRVSLNLSALHAAHAIAGGRTLLDPALHAAIEPSARRLAQELANIPLPTARLWRHLLPLSAEVADGKELARLTLVKALGGGSPVQIDRLAGRLLELDAVFKPAIRGGPSDRSPLESLRLRERPLRESFEARGPGLLKAIADLTEPDLVADNAAVLTVHPVLGGAGEAHLDYNSVRIESVLANPHPLLPEALRLGWLLAQLQQDLPRLGESIHRDRLPAIAALALLPAALAAGELVELTRHDRDTLATAIEYWRLETPPSWATDPASALLAWWETYRAAKPTWRAALGALASL